MGRLISGLCSITFRQLSAEEVVELVKTAGLETIEWGGDIHVPHGDVAKAREVRDLTKSAGLVSAAYGSYYRVGESEAAGLEFEDVLASAKALGAPTIRVWAGTRCSDVASQDYFEEVVQDTKRIASLAEGEGISVSFEYHGNTLTDTNEAAQSLFAACDHANLYTFWQPPHHKTTDYRAEGLKAVLPKLASLHTFCWPEPGVRRPLKEGQAEWLRYLEIAKSSDRDHPVMLEFVQDDSPENFLRDAQTLRAWLDG